MKHSFRSCMKIPVCGKMPEETYGIKLNTPGPGLYASEKDARASA